MTTFEKALTENAAASGVSAIIAGKTEPNQTGSLGVTGKTAPTPETPPQTNEGWQGIESAPRDGTEVIVLIRPKVIRLGWYFRPSSRTEGWCDENGRRIHPRYWMPLPPAPTPEPRA